MSVLRHCLIVSSLSAATTGSEARAQCRTSPKRRQQVRESLRRHRPAKKRATVEKEELLVTMRHRLQKAADRCRLCDPNFAVPDFVRVPLDPAYQVKAKRKQKRSPAPTIEEKRERRRQQNREDQRAKFEREKNHLLNLEAEFRHLDTSLLTCYSLLQNESEFGKEWMPETFANHFDSNFDVKVVPDDDPIIETATMSLSELVETCTELMEFVENGTGNLKPLLDF